MTTTTTLIVQGHAYAYTATVNDEVVVESSFDPGETGIHVHPLSSILIEGANTIRVGGTPGDQAAQLQVVLGTKQVGSQPRALLEETLTESFGISTTIELLPGDGLPPEMPVGTDLSYAKGPVMDLHEALHARDVPAIERLLRPAAQFWSVRDGTEPTWAASDYLRHLRNFVDDDTYILRPLQSLEFRAAAGRRIQVPIQAGVSAITFEHREHPEASFEFQVALAPSVERWRFVR